MPSKSAGTRSCSQQSLYRTAHDEKTRKATKKIGLKSRRCVKTPARKRSMVTEGRGVTVNRGRGKRKKEKGKKV